MIWTLAWVVITLFLMSLTLWLTGMIQRIRRRKVDEARRQAEPDSLANPADQLVFIGGCLSLVLLPFGAAAVVAILALLSAGGV